MNERLISRMFSVLVVGLAVSAVQAGVSFTDPAGGWAYIYTGDKCVTQFDACLDGTWNHNDAAAGGSDAWDGSAPGQMGAAGAKPSPGGAGIFTDGDIGFLRIQDCGDPRSAPGGGWADPGNRKLTFTHNITSEVTNPTTILDDGVTLSFRARIPTTPPLDPLYPANGGPLPWVTTGYNVHDDGYGAFCIKQGRTGLGIVSFSLAMDSDEGDISGNGLTMNKRVGTAISANVDSYDAGGAENTLTGFDPTEWHEFWIQIVKDTTGGGTHKVTIWRDGDVENPRTFHVTAGTKHEGAYDSWGGYLAMSLGRTGIAGAQDVDFFAYKVGLHVPLPSREPELAADPSPADKKTDVLAGTVLGWTPGELAKTHDVYLGTNPADVENADRSNPRGVLVSQGQDGTSYDPASLAFGATYFWRVDEVSATPDEIFKGAVWSFTVEPYGLPIVNITATASGSQTDMGPENTVNRSGLDAGDQHSTEPKEMWLSTNVQPNWIQYEFDKAYKLHELWVWNSNQLIEAFIGFGAKKVAIEYSLDGSTWTALDSVPEFAKATGLVTYTHNTTVPLGGAFAKYVKLTIQSSWGGLGQAGLSEVRFFYLPVQAREPVPPTGATGIDFDATVSWRPGREAASHKVYLGTDQDAVANGTAPSESVAESSYAPAGLEFGTAYFWRVDEVNDAMTPASWEGPVWSFSTREYEIVEDFESYNDDDNRIYDTWIDGWVNKTGSQVGYDASPFAERTIVSGGKQSMPFEYNNVNSPFYSEVEREFSTLEDWTGNGASTLVLNIRGRAAGFMEQAGGSILMGGGGADIWNAADQFRFAFKRLSGNGSIVAKVESLVRADPWTKVGVMIRENLDPGSRFAAVYATPDYGVRYQARIVNAGAATSDTAVATAEQIALRAPVWIKMERSGNNFSASYSTDGVKWTAMVWNPQTIAMTGDIYIGLAVNSHSATTMTTARFSNVTMTGAAGAWGVAEIGIAQPSNSPATLYVMVQDSAGKSKVVNHPDPAATVATAWQAWKVPLSEFTSAGVNLTKVKKMYIGVGSRTSPVKGGAGLLYIDDIGFGRPAAVNP